MLFAQQLRCAVLIGLSLTVAGSPTAAQEPAPLELTVAISATWVPYSFLDSDQRARGMLVDLWRLFGEKNDVEINFELTDWQASLDLADNGYEVILVEKSPSIGGTMAKLDKTFPTMDCSI